MTEQFLTNRAKIQFLFPFRVDRWEAFRNGLDAFLDEQEGGLYPALLEALHRLEVAFPYTVSVCDSRDLIHAYLDGGRNHPNRRRSDASVLVEIRDLVRKIPTYAHELYLAGQDLSCLELAELIREHEAKGPEDLMKLVCRKINSSKLRLFRKAEYYRGDNKGTRGYLERRQPHVEARLKAESLAIMNPLTLPDLAQKLPSHSSFRTKPGIRLTSTIILMSTGLGCLRLKAHLANKQGLSELVDEIVFTTDSRQDTPVASALEKKESLAKDLQKVILAAVPRRSMAAVEAVLRPYSVHLDTACTGNRLRRVIDEVTLASGELTTNDIIDLQNLDRGFVRGQEPRLKSGQLDSPSTLYEYFKNIVHDVFLTNLSNAFLEDQAIRDFINRPERRRIPRHSDSSPKEQLISALPNLALNNSSLAIEEHPYVSTFLSAPASFKKQELEESSEVVQHFRAMVERHRKSLSRILMKSKWSEIRSDWQPAISSLENVFYSDLIHMAVHIRSALCLYYAPTNADEYRLTPELAQAYKYREELNDTLQSLRILWYAYTVSDHLVARDIRSISAALEVLKEKSLREEFPEVIEGLADVIRGIDRRKIALAEIVEDPLSRKGGSSLFSEMVEKTSHAFHLKTLYENLHNKVERLDMLGIHVNETVQEYSSLLVQEGTRATQLTVEFLEAFIIGVYAADLTHLSLGKNEIYPFDHWWALGLTATGAFLVALPLITLIRRGRSKFSFENPGWLEWLENFGKIAGPALLLTVVFLAAVGSPHPGLAALLSVYLITVLAWRRVSDKVREISARLKGAMLHREQ